MANITLKQLRYAEALARHRHFGHAADACAISQPALSVQVRELEDQIGAPLFERAARQVRLTELGETLLPQMRDILRRVDDLASAARAAQDGIAGRLRLGVIPTVAPYLLPRIVRALGARFPDLDVHVRETLTDRLLSELRDGRLDAVLLALPVRDDALEQVPLLDEDMVLVRPASDRSAPQPLRADLAGLRLLLLEDGHCFRDHALSFCSMAGDAARDGLDGSSLSTLVQMVGAGIGVTLIPEMAVEVETRSAPVCISRFADAPPGRTIGMVWRKASPLAAKLADIATVAQDTVTARSHGPRIRPL